MDADCSAVAGAQQGPKIEAKLLIFIQNRINFLACLAKYYPEEKLVQPSRESVAALAQHMSAVKQFSANGQRASWI